MDNMHTVDAVTKLAACAPAWLDNAAGQARTGQGAAH